MKTKEFPTVVLQKKSTLKEYLHLCALVDELKKLDSPSEAIIFAINRIADEVNHAIPDEDMLLSSSEKGFKTLMNLLIFGHQIYPQRYYLKLMLTAGFFCIALPFAFFAWYFSGDTLHIFAALAVGYLLGILIGLYRDYRVSRSGKQISIKIDLV
ncbi:MAG: hypothetical protein ACK5JS_02950 [Mangrovibacterium sp.]